MSEEKHRLQRQADRARAGSRRSVLSYMVILFAAAIILLLMAYLMQQRTNEQAIDGLQQSVSAMQSAQDLYEENGTLKEQIDQLEQQLEEQEEAKRGTLEELDSLRQQIQALEQQAADLERAAQAMDWFWQINEAYVRGRNSLARELIESLNAAGLAEYLPRASITNNERFSPYDRYQEIYEDLS